MRSRIVPLEGAGFKIKYWAVSDENSFKFDMPWGIFEGTSATTGTDTIVALTEKTSTLTNGGVIDCPIKLKFTPSATCSLIRWEIASNMRIQLEKNYFASGSQVIFDTANNALTIGGVSFLLSQYLTAGSPFEIPAGSSSLYTYCDAGGALAYEFNARYI